jgi:hypothetical protein
VQKVPSQSEVGNFAITVIFQEELMNRTSTLSQFAIAVTSLGLLAVSCGKSNLGPVPAGFGRFAVEMVDAPAPHVTEIIVTVSKVTAHSSTAGWVNVMNGPLTVDLLKLQTHAIALGFTTLPPGKVTQIRLYVAPAGPQYVTLPSGEHIALKVPSGIQSGIKIKGPFGITACEQTTATIDFDGKKSIWVHPTGQGDLWILRPVIHTKKVRSEDVGCTDPDPEGEGEGEGEEPPIEEEPVTEGAGGNCNTNLNCLSGNCLAGVCQPGGPGAACVTTGDCTSSQCVNNSCAPPPPPTSLPAGSPCTQDSECVTGSCESVEHICEQGGTGAPCGAATDCMPDLSCLVIESASTCESEFN